MKIITSILTLIAAFTLAVPTTSHAATKKKPAAEEPKKDDKGKFEPFYGVVVSASDSLLTIKGGKDKPDRKFDINKETKIHDGEKAATVKDIKAGAWVGGRAEIVASGNPVATNINVGVKQGKGDKKDEPAETPKKKKKGA